MERDREQFKRILYLLIGEHTRLSPVVIGRDFNALTVEWGSRLTNARGYSIQEALARLGVVLVNVANTSTFRKNGRESSSPAIATTLSWKVDEGCEGYAIQEE